MKNSCLKSKTSLKHNCRVNWFLTNSFLQQQKKKKKKKKKKKNSFEIELIKTFKNLAYDLHGTNITSAGSN